MASEVVGTLAEQAALHRAALEAAVASAERRIADAAEFVSSKLSLTMTAAAAAAAASAAATATNDFIAAAAAPSQRDAARRMLDPLERRRRAVMAETAAVDAARIAAKRREASPPLGAADILRALSTYVSEHRATVLSAFREFDVEVRALISPEPPLASAALKKALTGPTPVCPLETQGLFPPLISISTLAHSQCIPLPLTPSLVLPFRARATWTRRPWCACASAWSPTCAPTTWPSSSPTCS